MAASLRARRAAEVWLLMVAGVVGTGGAGGVDGGVVAAGGVGGVDGGVVEAGASSAGGRRRGRRQGGVAGADGGVVAAGGVASVPAVARPGA